MRWTKSSALAGPYAGEEREIMKQQKITVASGNSYYVAANSVGLDVCSEEFDGSREYADRDKTVTVNRVEYFARGTFTLSPAKRWDPLALHAYRPGSFASPTAAARPKIEAEIIEAAAIFARTRPGLMVGGFAADLDSQAAAKIREAEKLELAAGVLRFDARELSDRADTACRAMLDGGAS